MNFSERFFAHYRALFLIFAIFFIYLLIIYPACPARGKKSDDSTCTSHRFFFLSVLSQAQPFECPPFHSGHFQRKNIFYCKQASPAELACLLFHRKSCFLCRERSRGTGFIAFIKIIAAGDAPLGQRQGGVFRVPPPYLWTPPTPQCNNCDRRQRQKQGAVVGAAASKTQVPPKARCGCWVPQPVRKGLLAPF